MLRTLLVTTLLIVKLVEANAQADTETWHLNSIKAVGGHAVTIWGNPKVTKAGKEKAIAFDGEDDGVLVNANPIAGTEEFSIEVLLKPYDVYPKNVEQLFLHIQDPENENRRILIELRLNDQKQWYADFFMRTDKASLTLIDSTKTHPVNEWATVKLVYKDKQMKGYVNGVEELTGQIEYLPINRSAKTSLGTRMDKRSWFNGAVKAVKFSHQALPE
ncbi:LamG domain-containing protein [Pontibacter silvestris]|uniref:LamG domain-containing protein n=1 Tax=Pontibacter silvestris TaxID=2305183 RepID=A0ABW4WTS2_9BACT|nr:LamG domain-containing protein [Pontibacter silvestris]MCC9137258.1 LamG domain-containing protein [Pontibacter silvestris]